MVTLALLAGYVLGFALILASVLLGGGKPDWGNVALWPLVLCLWLGQKVVWMLRS